MANYTDLNVDIPEKEFSDIEVLCSAANLEITLSDDDTAHIIARNIPEGSYAAAENGKLTVDIKRPAIKEMIINIPFHPRSCRLSLPAKLYDTILIKTGVGNSTINGIQCNSAEIYSGSGNISIDNSASFKELRIESGTGNISIDKLQVGRLSVKSGTGNVSVRNSVSGGLDIKGGTGNITYEGSVNGDIDIKGGIGNIDLALNSECRDKHKVNAAHGIGKINIRYI
jgi:DUF4097 and DUF4098 domain-containing protein YvlB